MLINIAIIERSPVWAVLKEDMYKAFVYWFQQAGFIVSLTNNEVMFDRPNVIVGNFYLSNDHIQAIIDSRIPYGLIETEIVTSSGHNSTEDVERFDYHKRLYQSARVIMSGAAPNIAAFAELGFIAHLIRLGYCPWLDTSRPLPDEHQDVDLLFFGNLDTRREAMLKILAKDFTVKTLAIDNGFLPHYLRNAWVSRSKINLSLRRGAPYTHLGVSRIWHLAHLQAMTLSEPPGEDDHTADGLCEFREFEEFKDTIHHYLANPEERLAKGEEFHRNLKNIKTEDIMKTVVARLASACG